MTTNHWNDIVLTKDEYEFLRSKLAECGVNLNFSMTDCKTFECYVSNPYKQVVEGLGNELENKLAKEFYDRDAKRG